MQKIRVIHQKTKGQRIQRIGRPVLELRSQKNDNDWRSEYLIFKKRDGGTVFLKREWENERKLKGLPSFSTSGSGMGFTSSVCTINVGSSSVKSILRFIRKHMEYFPTGTVFCDFAGWIGYGIIFTVRNDEYNEESLKEKLYSGMTLGKEYSGLSDNEDFNRLAVAMREKGYLVMVEKNEDGFWEGFTNSLGIKACFCTESEEIGYATYLSGKIAADRSTDFDKWSRCDYGAPLPKNEKETMEIIEQLERMKK